MRRTRKKLLIAAAIAAGLLLAGALSRPFVVRALSARMQQEVERQISMALGAPVRMERADFGIFPAVVLLHDLRLERDGLFGLKAASTVERIELRGGARALAR